MASPAVAPEGGGGSGGRTKGGRLTTTKDDSVGGDESIDNSGSATTNTKKHNTTTSTTTDDQNSRRKRRRRFRGSLALSHNSTSRDGSSSMDDGEHRISISSEHDEIEKLVAADIAICKSNQNKTVALIAARLSSWAVTVYGGERPFR